MKRYLFLLLVDNLRCGMLRCNMCVGAFGCLHVNAFHDMSDNLYCLLVKCDCACVLHHLTVGAICLQCVVFVVFFCV